jgi:hypothetical protein
VAGNILKIAVSPARSATKGTKLPPALMPTCAVAAAAVARFLRKQMPAVETLVLLVPAMIAGVVESDATTLLMPTLFMVAVTFSALMLFDRKPFSTFMLML